MSSLVKDLSDGVRLIQLMVSNRKHRTYWQLRLQLSIGNHGYVSKHLLHVFCLHLINRRYLAWAIQPQSTHTSAESGECEQSVGIHPVAGCQAH